jgi:hypothetical protein
VVEVLVGDLEARVDLGSQLQGDLIALSRALLDLGINLDVRGACWLLFVNQYAFVIIFELVGRFELPNNGAIPKNFFLDNFLVDTVFDH